MPSSFSAPPGQGKRHGKLYPNAIQFAGLRSIALRAVSFAIPIFTTRWTKAETKIGDLKLQATQSTSYTTPPLNSAAVIAVGLVLVRAGPVRRRG